MNLAARTSIAREAQGRPSQEAGEDWSYCLVDDVAFVPAEPA
jgi:hypothetical protein